MRGREKGVRRREEKRGRGWSDTPDKVLVKM